MLKVIIQPRFLEVKRCCGSLATYDFLSCTIKNTIRIIREMKMHHADTKSIPISAHPSIKPANTTSTLIIKSIRKSLSVFFITFYYSIIWHSPKCKRRLSKIQNNQILSTYPKQKKRSC